jgi:hypothetical protein
VSCDPEFYRRVVGEDAATERPPLDGPRGRLRRGQAAHEDLVDAAVEPAGGDVLGEVGVAAEVDQLIANDAPDTPQNKLAAERMQ